MPYVLGIKVGKRLTLLNVLDVTEAVEDYVDTDIRQYLEEYLLEAESETRGIAGEEIYDHYKQMPMNIKDEAEAAAGLMEKPCMDRKAIRVTLDIILKMIEGEYWG